MSAACPAPGKLSIQFTICKIGEGEVAGRLGDRRSEIRGPSGTVGDSNRENRHDRSGRCRNAAGEGAAGAVPAGGGAAVGKPRKQSRGRRPPPKKIFLTP